MAKKYQAFSPSHREEIISILWLIAGLLAWNAGIRWLAYCLFVKSAWDNVCSIVLGVLEEKMRNLANKKEPEFMQAVMDIVNKKR